MQVNRLLAANVWFQTEISSPLIMLVTCWCLALRSKDVIYLFPIVTSLWCFVTQI